MHLVDVVERRAPRHVLGAPHVEVAQASKLPLRAIKCDAHTKSHTVPRDHPRRLPLTGNELPGAEVGEHVALEVRRGVRHQYSSAAAVPLQLTQGGGARHLLEGMRSARTTQIPQQLAEVPLCLGPAPLRQAKPRSSILQALKHS